MQHPSQYLAATMAGKARSFGTAVLKFWSTSVRLLLPLAGFRCYKINLFLTAINQHVTLFKNVTLSHYTVHATFCTPTAL
jgi:hypothetical protein